MLPIRLLICALAALSLLPHAAHADDTDLRAPLERLAAVEQGQPRPYNRVSANELRQFYAHHGFLPVWQAPGRLDALLAQLEALRHDGLSPEDYGFDSLQHLPRPTAGGTLAACDDLLATAAYLQALMHLRVGKLDPAGVEPSWRFEGAQADNREATRAALVAAAAADIDDLAGAFERARPNLAQYRILRAALTHFAQHPDTVWPTVPSGPTLRPGDTHARVAALRTRLLASGHLPADGGGLDAAAPAGDAEAAAPSSVDALATSAAPAAMTPAAMTPADPARFDDTLLAAVVAFQHAHGLEGDGVVGPATLAALNVPYARRLAQLRVNLERTRWLAREILPTFVLVNVAGARITYFRDGDVVWQARTQVGRPARPTPLLRSEITHFTLNPTWTIPPTILRKDKLPEIQRDIDYLARNRIRVLDYHGKELPPESVDWTRPGAVMLRQDAGPGNALGQVAIRFPNPFSVYLHDTPSQRLFARDQRAFSSGCVRVEGAFGLVEHLIADFGDITPERVRALRDSGRTRNLNLARPVPILVAYWTAGADDEGRPVFRQDIYDHDEKLVRALDTKHPVLPDLRAAGCR